MASVNGEEAGEVKPGIEPGAGRVNSSGMSEELPHHHADAQDRAFLGARTVAAGIAVNAGLAAVKFAGGIVGHSYALIADGTESLLDVLSSILVWAGFQVAARPPDDNHPYGHGRAEPLAALAGVILVFAAAGGVGWGAIRGITTAHPGPHWGTLPLLAGIVASKIWLFHRMDRAGREAGSIALGLEAWHHGADAITSAAAFIGISVAVIGGHGWEAADSWAALFACVIIVVNGSRILVRTLGEMMDAAAPGEFENQVRAIAAAVPGVRGLDKCRIRKSGLSFLVDIHVKVDGDLTVIAGHSIGHSVKSALLTSPLRVTDVLVHIEPTEPRIPL
jgi:cation diffusion facilitator family transporter